jgi:large subunit ribosomal protein L35
MPKMKTRKSAKRRFKVTGSGKIMRMKGLRSHFRRRKSPRNQRAMDKMFEVSSSDRKRFKKLLPYGTK